MKKIKLNYTKQGYSYIKCTREECFSWGGACICDSCSKDMKEEIYLIFVLGRAYCKECFKDWTLRSKRYKEDLILQNERHLEWYRAYGFEPIEDRKITHSFVKEERVKNETDRR